MNKFYIFVADDRLLKHYLFDSLRKRGLLVDEPRKATAGILVAGGDGTMLKAIRRFWGLGLSFFGFNFGHVGFLMNEPTERVLTELVEGYTEAISVKLLEAQLYDQQGKRLGRELAFNEFYAEKAELLQTAKIRVTVDSKMRFDPLICNGILVCTQAGSTAYNAAAGGEILPIEADAMVLTGIAPAIFHRWRSSILPRDSEVVFEAVDVAERPVTFVADNKVLSGTTKAVIRYSSETVRLVFSESQDFREKVLRLKF